MISESDTEMKDHRFIGFVLLLVFIFLSGRLEGQSNDGARDVAIPHSLSCAADCPSVGIEIHGVRQVLSPISNDCVGTPLRLVFGHLGIDIDVEKDECPLWIIIEPERGIPAVQPGCCLASIEAKPVVQQNLNCDCIRWFLICWDQECAPSGTPWTISEVISYIASPCPGQFPSSPCQRLAK
ncbi:MAG: hypothetical protein AAEJ04_08435 [Planctomycetota bacterium]